MESFSSEITSTLYGNPHSGSSPSQLSTARIEDVRMNLMSFFGADPEEYDLVFVANATAGVKLVIDGMRSQPGGWHYAYHEACHTSLIGAREEALESICLDDAAVQDWLDGKDPFDECTTTSPNILFSYSAQSSMDGRRYPLQWTKTLREKNPRPSSRLLTLLDAASLSATSPFDLGDLSVAPDFAVFSLYKIFGFPDIGALIIRRSAESLFDRRKYFGGGTVDMVVCGKESWHAPKSHSLHERLEDGTLPFHSIIATGIAMDVHKKLFGSMRQVRAHTSFLTQELLLGLERLKHGNGEPVCVTYTKQCKDDDLGTGPVVSFNLKHSDGAWVSLAEFEKLAVLKKVHVRTGGLCSPGSIASALHLQPWEMRQNFSAGFRCGNDNDIISGKPTGVIRASLGAMSTRSDVKNLTTFIEEFFLDEEPSEVSSNSLVPTLTYSQASLQVKAITVFPIKSCGGFSIPPGTSWEVRPEGLAWDREWCLVHQGSGQALSQKRFPRMALLQPSIDFDNGHLKVLDRGSEDKEVLSEILIPLSADPSVLDVNYRQISSRVCGDSITVQRYISNDINGFFSKALGVPCQLARFPAGGRGSASRLSKAQVPKYQQAHKPVLQPTNVPDMPSPPDSDTEQQPSGKILLSNESPILMIQTSSVNALNEYIAHQGGRPMNDTAFRANIVLDSAPGAIKHPAYSEDSWKSIRIGRLNFKLLGACRRCQMVCVDQQTGVKNESPFFALAKTRRFDGKVYFGEHMMHDPSSQPIGIIQYPTINVDDLVSIDSERDE